MYPNIKPKHENDPNYINNLKLKLTPPAQSNIGIQQTSGKSLDKLDELSPQFHQKLAGNFTT